MLRLLGVAFAVCVLGTVAFASSSSAEPTPGIGWAVYTDVAPSSLPPGGSGEIQLMIMNVGAGRSSGPITVTDTLPAGVSATRVGGLAGFSEKILSPLEEANGENGLNEVDGYRSHGARWRCEGTTTVTCTSDPAVLPGLPVPHPALRMGANIVERIGIAVSVSPEAASVTLQNRVTVSGGGAPVSATSLDPLTVSSSEPPFGFSNVNLWFSNPDGTLDTQAGSHPYEAIFLINLNERAKSEDGSFMADGYVRNIVAYLPRGFFGDPQVMPQCTRTLLNAHQCPPQTQVGVLGAGKSDEINGGLAGYVQNPAYNMAPPPGVADEIGLSINGVSAFLDATVSSAHGYDIVVHADDIPLAASLDSSLVRLWGVPAASSHDPERCTVIEGKAGIEPVCGLPAGIAPKPFLTVPTSCEGPQPFTVQGLGTWTDESAKAEASALTHDGFGAAAGFSGCQQLSMEPSLNAAPETAFGDTPTGLGVEVNVPQESLTDPEGLAASTLKNATVTLPAGVAINPGQAAGLAVCGEAEANLHGEGPASCPWPRKWAR